MGSRRGVSRQSHWSPEECARRHSNWQIQRPTGYQQRARTEHPRIIKRRFQVAVQELEGIKVAILATDGFEQVELVEPRKALDNAGARTSVVSPKDDKIRGWKFTEWGDEIKVDIPLKEAHAEQFDALLLPGGVINPDKLRMIPEAVDFVRSFFQADKPVAAICHGPWTIVEAGQARGKRITSWPSLKTDLKNAGAEWVDEPVVIDRNLVSSRKPDDIPQFSKGMIDLFSKKSGKARQPAA